jgi:enoyl-CoA hydratase/carnithine racemase
MPVEFEQRGRVALLTLNRPEKMNALDAHMMEQLDQAWQRIRDDDDIWVAIVTGAGDRAFCYGRDLLAGAPGSPEYHRARLERGEQVEPREMRYAPDNIWKPVIAAVNGYALAGGFALALACDFRIAADTARIGSMAVKRNLLGGGGQTQRLTRYVPFAKALELLLFGDHISAAECERIGLVNKVVSQEELLPTAFEWADRLCRNGPLAVRATKEAAYRGGLDMTFRDGMRLEGTFYNQMLETDDVLEGARAFAERREPVWKGR